MTSLYETTSRLIDERLDELLALGWQLPDLTADPAHPAPGTQPLTWQVARLVGAAMALMRQHALDSRGRCRICTCRRRIRRKRTQPCTVYAALNFYLTQPDELVLRQLPKPPANQANRSS